MQSDVGALQKRQLLCQNVGQLYRSVKLQGIDLAKTARFQFNSIRSSSRGKGVLPKSSRRDKVDGVAIGR